MEFEERIVVAQDREWGCNCRKTALFIVGVVPEDGRLDSDEARYYVDRMPLLDEPHMHCLVVYRKEGGKIAHMGVVHYLEPTRILHRWKDGAKLAQCCVDRAGSPDARIEYRDPSSFTKF